MRPFVRRRFGAKQVVDLEFFRARVRASAPLEWLLIGERIAGSSPSVRACSPARAAAALAANLVAGIGTPQVLELMAPASPYFAGGVSLASVAVKRAACAA